MKFKKGDIVAFDVTDTGSTGVFVLDYTYGGNSCCVMCGVTGDGSLVFNDRGWGIYDSNRFATESDKTILFNALAKENKYYCEKTKTIKEIGVNKEIIDFTSTNGLTFKIWEDFKEEILSLKTKTIKEMKKKDLKSGMWVELRNGNRYMVIKDCDTMLHGKQCFCLVRNDGYLISDEYTDCLTCSDSEYNEFDICAVYSTSGDVVNGNTYTGEDMSVIWERSDSQDKIRAKISELQRVIEELEAELR